jgi:hypothetical protein
VGVYDVGRVVNPLTARSQLIGGLTMGLSMALHEETIKVNIIGRRRVTTGRRIISVDIVEFTVSAVSAPLGGAFG